jgi:hypothetical protein
MIRERTDRPLIIDLTGPQGNAFFLIGIARNLAKQIGIDSTPIINEMMSGDYENLIKVLDANFGDYIILER